MHKGVEHEHCRSSALSLSTRRQHWKSVESNHPWVF